MQLLRKYFSGLTFNTFLLTFASLFSDISTEMLYPVLPIFLTQTLGAPASIVGVVEGIATATQNIIQGFSGWLADTLQQHKKIALVGYTFAALSKPLIGFSTLWQEVLGARFLDRLGTGIRSAPRDGLIAASAEEKNRGKAFGLEGIGDNFGAFVGPLIAAALLFLFFIPIRWIFYLAVIPGLLAVVMITLVRENSKSETRNRKQYQNTQPKADEHLAQNDENLKRFDNSNFKYLNLFRLPAGKAGISDFGIRVFPKGYYKYLFVTALFGIGNSSNAFLILRTKQIGIPFVVTIIIYAFFNLVAALSSFPAGNLSDKFGRKNILLGSFIVFIISYLGFALTTNYILLATVFILYGIFSGAYRAVGKALATDFVKPQLRASAVGWFSTTVGVSGLLASLVAGQLWTAINPSAAFLFGAIFAMLGTVALIILVESKRAT